MKLGLKSIKEAGDLRGKRVVLRLDLNVPMEKGRICDDFRIQKALPTVNYLKNEGAICLILSHLDAAKESLKPVADYLKIPFRSDLFDGEITETTLFENIRQYPEEEKNDSTFAKKIADLGEIYINDAFPASHREHASIVGVPKFLPHYAGIQFEEEIDHLYLDGNPPRPFLFILGGAKFETKLPLIEKFLAKADHCFIAGALSNDFFKAKGWEIGVSLVSNIDFDKQMLENPKLILPTEVMVKNTSGVLPKSPAGISPEDKIVDSGPKVLQQLRDLIKESKLILWNGPLGYYEDGFDQPTKDLAKMISERTAAAETIIGGGDTIAAIESLGIRDKFTFVSTGGGAMLEFLLNDTLPGIEVLKI
jgi:phosphoglycerate kinase